MKALLAKAEEQGARDIDACLQACEEAIQIDPQRYEAHVKAAQLYRVIGEVKTSLSMTRSALEIAASYPAAYVTRGAAFEDLGKMHRAENMHRHGNTGP